MILDIVRSPDPRLRQVSRPVREDEFGAALVQTLADMVTTMQVERGVGLAGVQVGDMRRILVAVIDGVPTTMINPTVTRRSKLTYAASEGCLSVPGRMASKTRSRQVTVAYRTAGGDTREATLTGMNARIVLHEVDHIDGKLI